ncbi:hypothetical protein PIROE2DRAFT_16604, partial [Piromyces sp. E2]
ATAFSYDRGGGAVSSLIKKFNKYSKENNLDIEIELNLYTEVNSTKLVTDYGSTIEYLLKQGSTKYDIFFHDVMYNRRYSSYFIDLSKYLSKEHIEMYAEGITEKACTYENRWVGLPVHIDFTVLYSNMELLNKYNKTIPTTWDELLETGKYIKERENNENLLIYNGLFP